MTRDPKPIPYGRQWIEEDDIQAVVECLRGDWITQGPTIDRFERALCEVTGAKHAVAVSSGTAALHLAARAAGVGPGDTGVVPAITFVATANCVLYCGGRVAFADVDPDSALVDLDDLERKVDQLAREGRPPKVIVPVDMCGQPADLPGVRRLADKVRAKVVEDAAHALGATYVHEGRTFRAGCCEHTDLAILSFHPVKHITTGEGGAVLTNDPSLADRVRNLRSHGIHQVAPERMESLDEGPWYYEQDDLGYNYRITDIQCALGLAQIRKLDGFVARRREIAARYDAALSEPPMSERVRPLRRIPGRGHAYHLYVVRMIPRNGENLRDVALRRKALYLRLRERGILAQVHYIPVPLHPYHRSTTKPHADVCPKALDYYSGCLSLPMYPRMKEADVVRSLDALWEALA